MLYGTGIDIVDINRIVDAAERWGNRFLERIYTEQELHYCRRQHHPFPELAARFCAKEAAFKALGTGLRRGVRWRDVEVLNEKSGKPVIKLHRRAAQIAADAGVSNVFVTLSHERSYAVAQVIMEK